MVENTQARRPQAGFRFQDREDELDFICASDTDSSLINIYGVAGIGKSRLLAEAATRITALHSRAMVIQVDLESVEQESPAFQKSLLTAIIEQAPKQLSGVWKSAEQVGSEITQRLGDLASYAPVFLVLDATERFQENVDFWRWMETNLVGPLITETGVRLIFSGRVPVPWRRWEVRRAVRLLSLDPLPTEMATASLISEVLLHNNPTLSPQVIHSAALLLCSLSLGHPLLSQELAAHAAPRLPEALDRPEELQRELSEVVGRFSETCLFEYLDPPWPEILEWASVLDEFDALLLERYIGKVDTSLVSGKPENFFIKGVPEMRIRHALIWYAGEGYVVHGILRDILRNSLEVSHPERLQRAYQAAVDVYENMAKELEEPEEAQNCLDKAAKYKGMILQSDTSAKESEK